MTSETILAHGYGRSSQILLLLNGPFHREALRVLLALTLAHWLEHILQAIQVFVLRWPRGVSRGALGLLFPWLVASEWLHYAYALVMLLGLVFLRSGFRGRSRRWWDAALVIQVWHHAEHMLLLGQALAHQPLFGASVPTSLLQLVIPRVELHLVYNALVFIPMMVAMCEHMRPRFGLRDPADLPPCNCVRIRQHEILGATRTTLRFQTSGQTLVPLRDRGRAVWPGAPSWVIRTRAGGDGREVSVTWAVARFPPIMELDPPLRWLVVAISATSDISTQAIRPSSSPAMRAGCSIKGLVGAPRSSRAADGSRIPATVVQFPSFTACGPMDGGSGWRNGSRNAARLPGGIGSLYLSPRPRSRVCRKGAQAGNMAPNTEISCHVPCGVFADEAACVTDTALADLQWHGPDLAYDAWRSRVQMTFARERIT